MSEELKALEDLINFIGSGEIVDTHEICEYVAKRKDIIETALKRLKTLEEENKSLRANIENLDETYFETWLVCEELKKNSNYALMFIDNIYCLVDTKDNKFEVIDNYEINNYGIIDNGVQKKLKALEIIKEYKLITYQEWCNAICTTGYVHDLPQEIVDLLREVLL